GASAKPNVFLSTPSRSANPLTLLLFFYSAAQQKLLASAFGVCRSKPFPERPFLCRRFLDQGIRIDNLRRCRVARKSVPERDIASSACANQLRVRGLRSSRSERQQPTQAELTRTEIQEGRCRMGEYHKRSKAAAASFEVS